MSDFLHQLMEQRRKFLDGLDANQGDINLDIFEDFYPDQAHFVFELLQNAEDAEASEAVFTLTLLGACAILLFLVLRRMTGQLWSSALAAALFAVHPGRW